MRLLLLRYGHGVSVSGAAGLVGLRRGGRPDARTETLVEAKLGQLRPPGICRSLVLVARARLVQIHATDRAQPGAILAAEKHHGERQSESVTSPGSEIELLALEVRRGELLSATRLRDLTGVDVERGLSIGQTAHAGSGESSRKAQPERIAVPGGPGHIEHDRHQARRHRITLATQRERFDGHGQLKPPALPGSQMQARELKSVRARRHRIELSDR